MNELINIWNEKNKPYLLVANKFPYYTDGVHKATWTLVIYNLDTKERILVEKGDDFLKIYNSITDKWDNNKGDFSN